MQERDESGEESREQGLISFLLHYRVECRESRVCVSLTCVVFLLWQNKCTWRCLDLPFSPSVLLSSCGDLSLLIGVSIVDPRDKKEKKKPSQSYCQFAFLPLLLISSSDLRLVIID